MGHREYAAWAASLVLGVVLAGCSGSTAGQQAQSESVESLRSASGLFETQSTSSLPSNDYGQSSASSLDPDESSRDGGEATVDAGEVATASQEQAARKAADYLDYSSFSRQGLIEQLEFEGFSTADAAYGVDSLSVDWKKQAAQKAKDYLDYSAFSPEGLIEQLEFEGFTNAQAEYGAEAAFNDSGGGAAGGGSGSASAVQAAKKAEEYLSFSAFSRAGLIDQLEFEGFSTADATYGVDSLGANWKQQAALKAAEYLDFSAFSRQGLIDQLEFEGFTSSEAQYGVSQVGL